MHEPILKVYVLVDWEAYEEETIEGVFSTFVSAMQAAAPDGGEWQEETDWKKRRAWERVTRRDYSGFGHHGQTITEFEVSS